MSYKEVEVVGSFVSHGRGQILLTTDNSVTPGETIRALDRLWRVNSVECSQNGTHYGLQVVAVTESMLKQETANQAKAIIETMFPKEELIDKHVDDPVAAMAELFGNSRALFGPVTPKQEVKRPDAIIQLGNISGKQPLNTEEQKGKLLKTLNELNDRMGSLRNWTLQELSKFDLGEDSPAVVVVVISMPKTAMQDYLRLLEQFLSRSVDLLEKDTKLPWANVKAIAGAKD